jgi:lipopolysaccharide export system permease protein
MRLLDRYLFRELLAPLFFCLIGIQSLVIFFTVLGDESRIQEAKLHFGETMAYAAATSMQLMPLVLPVCLLLALLMALTQHARYNEITAMRAAGISLWRICIPYFIVGLIASAVVFALNESIVPRCANFSARLMTRYLQPGKNTKDHVTNLGFTNERGHRTWVIRDYRISTGAMTSPQVDWILPDGSRHRLYADRAVRTNDVWTFYNAEELSQADPASLFVPMLKTNELAMPEFDETPREINGEIQIGTYLGFAGLRDANIPLKDVFAYLKWHPNMSPGDKSRLLTELHERIATPFTCLVVALIAIPFGAAPGRRNLFFGVAGSIFIFFAYYVLQRVSLAYGSSGALPAWLAAWLPNLFFAVLGLILTLRIR